LLSQLGNDLIARRTLPEAATALPDFGRQSKPEWLRGVGRLYPGRSEEAAGRERGRAGGAAGLRNRHLLSGARECTQNGAVRRCQF
jgi:hypothetical protein